MTNEDKSTEENAIRFQIKSFCLYDRPYDQ